MSPHPEVWPEYTCECDNSGYPLPVRCAVPAQLEKYKPQKTFRELYDDFVSDRGYEGKDDIMYFPQEKFGAMLAMVTPDTSTPGEIKAGQEKRELELQTQETARSIRIAQFAVIGVAMIVICLLHFVPGFY